MVDVPYQPPPQASVTTTTTVTQTRCIERDLPSSDPPRRPLHSFSPIARREIDLRPLPNDDAVTLQNLTTSVQNAESTVHCFQRPTPGGSRPLKPVDKPACNYLITNALIDIDIYPYASFSWSYPPNRSDKQLPADGEWAYDGCAINVFNLRQDEVGFFRLYDIAERAISVMEQCVGNNKWQWGGITTLGVANSHFIVEVAGEGNWTPGDLRNVLPVEGMNTILGEVGERVEPTLVE